MIDIFEKYNIPEETNRGKMKNKNVKQVCSV